MLRHLLIKDLRRARGNPWPYIIFLSIPLLITGLIGFVFGGASQGEGLGKIKLAIVDLDQSVISSMIRSGLNQGEADKYLDPVFTDETEGLRLINENQVSAVLIIPKNFTADYLNGKTTGPIRLIKNPAQSYYPAIMEALIRSLSTVLDSVSRNLKTELTLVGDMFNKEGTPDFIALSKLMLELKVKFEFAEDYLFPLLVSYGAETKTDPNEVTKKEGFNLFGYLLPMLSSMFLLFLADGAMRDIYKEQRICTLDRLRSINNHLTIFICSKMLGAALIVVLGGLILFVGGGWAFGVEWKHPLKILVLLVAFALGGAGINALLVAFARNEKRSDMLGGVFMMAISMIGGSVFQVDALPGFIRNYLSPWMPNYWFIQAVQNVEFQSGHTHWIVSSLKLGGLGLVCMVLSAWILQRFYTKGVRA